MTDDKPQHQPTAVDIAKAVAEREAAEGIVGLNKGMRYGHNPRFRWPSPHNPNAKWDGKRFIKGTSYFDMLEQRPIPPKR